MRCRPSSSTAIRHVLQDRARALGLDVPLAPFASLKDAAAAFAERVARLAVADRRSGTRGSDAAIVAAIELATAAVASGEALALVTNPITKRSLNLAQLPYPGHTEFLAELAARHWRRRASATRHDAGGGGAEGCAGHRAHSAGGGAGALTAPLLVETIRITAAALADDFGIAAAAHRRRRAQSARRRRRPHRPRGHRPDRSGHRRACRRGSRRDRPATPPTPCFMPRRGAPMTPSSPCITTRR